jgi:ribosome maturation factor RimP
VVLTKLELIYTDESGCISGKSNLEAWLEKVEKIAQEIAEREGCILYDLEHTGAGRGRILRVYIDKAEGVGIEDCSNVSKGLNLRLDVENVVPGDMYNLEVSTPGLDRHLKKHWHFEKAVGKKIAVQLGKSLGALGATEDKGMISMKKFEEVLENVDAENLYFDLRKQKVKVPFTAVEKAKLVFEYKTNTTKKK